MANIQKETVLQLAASAEDGSEHPLGEAIVAAAKQQKLTFSSVSHFQAVLVMESREDWMEKTCC